MIRIVLYQSGDLLLGVFDKPVQLVGRCFTIDHGPDVAGELIA